MRAPRRRAGQPARPSMHALCSTSISYPYADKGRAPVRRPLSASRERRGHLVRLACCCCCRAPPSLPWGFLRHWGDVVFVTLSHPKQSPTEHCEAEPPGGAGTQYQYFTEPQSVSQLFHGPAPRRSPLHRLAVRLRHSRTLNEVCQFSQVQSSQVKSTSHLLLRRGHVGQHLTTCRL